jgi:hypothetical protein
MHGKRDAAALRAAVLERELIDALRRKSFEDVESIPEMRALMKYAMEQQHERSLIAESLDCLPHSAVQKLFEDYVEEKFDVHLHSFFGKLYDGIMSVIRKSLSGRMELLEECMEDLKRSTLMAALHPHAWVEGEIVNAICEFLYTQPGYKAGLHNMYRYVAYDARLPMPGASQVEKYHYLLRVLRRTERIRELESFLFELSDFKVIEERESYATSAGHRDAVALQAIMNKIGAMEVEKDS